MMLKETVYDKAEYEYITEYYVHGLSRVKRKGLWGYIDERRVEVIPCIYEDADPFWEGVARVKLGGLYGYIDIDGSSISKSRSE